MANPSIFETSVLSGTDDAEERSSGLMALFDSDLDMVSYRHRNDVIDQKVGIRFTGIDVPQGATITSAYLQFTADEKNDVSTSLLVQGENTDDAATFTNVRNNISARPTTEASAAWEPEAWSKVGESNLAERTPDLSSIVQEIVARPGWSAGSDMAFIISGTGDRTAESFERGNATPPILHIEWVPGGSDTVDKTAPDVAMNGPAEGSKVSGTITLTATASDNVGVTGVQFVVDGNNVGAVDTSAPFAAKLDTTKLSDGTVALAAIATDAAGNQTTSAPITVTIDNSGNEPPPPPPPPSGTIRVPEDFATIQQAVNAAGDGDTIVVGPGTYTGGIVIAGKSITLTSLYQIDHDPSLVDKTIISGGAPGILVDDSASNTTIAGLHFVGGQKSVQFFAQGGHIVDSFFDHPGSDAISFENVGGVAQGNRVVGAGDDGVDVDAATGNILIQNNTFSQMGDDGIEIRNQNYHGPQVTLTIQGNTITGSDEDGIQLIDYSELSNRAFVIENNQIKGNAFVGLGIMDNGETREDFRGASMPEPVKVSGNTFDGNRYGITGGDNLTATNNTISNSEVGLKNVDGNSTVTGTTFINNQTDFIHSNVVAAAMPLNGSSLSIQDVLDVAGPAGGDASRTQFSSGTGDAGRMAIALISHVEQPTDTDTTSHLAP